VSEAACRSSVPVFHTDGVRTRLSYPCLEDARLVHGLVVFKNLTLGADYAAWHAMVSVELRSSLAPAPDRIVIPHQVHSSRVIDADAAGPGVPVADALVTGAPSTAIAVSVSDCVPLFAVDFEHGVIGLAHCGWKGTAGGVVEEFLRGLIAKEADPKATTFVVGAAIGSCCYRVHDDLLECFDSREAAKYSRPAGGGMFFDLKGVVASRLISAGAARAKVSIDDTCTSCRSDILASYRKEGKACGRMLAFLMLTP
jgi:YfiH family protein